MNTEFPVTKNMFFICLTLSLVFFIFILICNFLDQTTTIVFCNVDHGDATYIRVKNRTDILINTGENKKILGCLGRNMPVFDRTIEYIFLLSTNKTSIGGMSNLFDRYKIGMIYIPNKEDANLKEILDSIHRKNIHTAVLDNMESLKIDDDSIKRIIAPTNTRKNALESLLFIEKQYRILLTGHSSGNILKSFVLNPTYLPMDIYILQLSYLGLDNNIIDSFLELADLHHTVINIDKSQIPLYISKDVLGRFKAMDKDVVNTTKNDIIFKLKPVK